MAQTNVSIRMDEDLKKQFDAFCSDIGMSMTTAFCVFAKKAVRERRIPFEITADADPFYSPENMQRLRKSIAQMEPGQNRESDFGKPGPCDSARMKGLQKGGLESAKREPLEETRGVDDK